MKSHVSICLALLENIFKDVSSMCGIEQPMRDLLTIKSRVEDEGLSFLTITLPDFAKDFERSLELGQIDPRFFRSFKKNRRIPAFLQGFLDHIFDKETGGLYDQFDPIFVYAVRQITCVFKKIKLECTKERVKKAFSSYLKAEEDLKSLEFVFGNDRDRVVNSVSKILWDCMVYNLDYESYFPRHGPGSTQEKHTGNSKYVIKSWTDEIESYFPLVGSGLPMASISSKELDSVQYLAKMPPVRVISVPKTLKTPRIIAIEPVAMQFLQQQLAQCLIEGIEKNPLTKGHINFTDQSVNRVLAMNASVDRRLATVDLSEASDRVRNDFISRLFVKNEDFFRALQACRSTQADVQGQVIDLVKFSSMGSAMCFPVEAMWFYTLAISAQLAHQQLSCTYYNVKKLTRNTYVYGDDIIVPVDAVPTIDEWFTAFGLKVNTAKTFRKGFFRESCGMDAYYGMDVTPTYIRHLPPSSRRHTDRILSTVATSNLMFKAGLWKTSEYLRKILESCTKDTLPVVKSSSACVGLHTFMEKKLKAFDAFEQMHSKRLRFNSNFQRWEIKALSVQPITVSDRLEGVYALSKSLLHMERRDSTSIVDPPLECGLERSERRGHVALKYRWVPNY